MSVRIRLAWCFSVLLVATTCKDGSGPTETALRVTVATTGVDLDPDGYSVGLNGQPGEPVPVDGSVTFSGLVPGTYTVALAGIAGNCELSGPNPRQVNVVSGDTTKLALAVACVTATGSIQVRTATTGADPDPDGYRVRVDAGAPLAIGTGGVVTVSGLSVGAHSVTLAGITDNCAVDGEDPRPVVVPGLDTARLTFSLACTATSPPPTDSTIVSNPILVTASIQSDGVGARLTFLSTSDSTVYVSMLPGTLSHGDSVVIRNRTSGARVVVSMLSGGFDPVPLQAIVGDTVEVVATDSAHLTLAFLTLVRPTRPPIVVRSEPPGKKTDVPINAALMVVFSEPMNGRTISTGTVRLLHDSEPVPGTAVLNPDGLRVEYHPAAPLAPNSPYVLTVTTGVIDLTAERLEQPVQVQFTTGAAATQPASLTVSPAFSTIAVGDQLQLTAALRDAAGYELDGAISWLTSNSSVTISATGLMTGIRVGGDTIVARSGGLTGGAFVLVLDSTSINLRGSWDWTMTLVDATRGVTCGHSGTFVFSQLAVNLGGPGEQAGTCNGPMKFSLSSLYGVNGRVRGDSISLSFGSCTYLAQVSGTRPVLLQGTVTCPDSDLVGKWNGTWRAHLPWPVGAIDMAAPPPIATSETAQLTAQLRDTAGNHVFQRVLTWSSSDQTIATVSGSGLVGGVALGQATITAAVEGKSAGVAVKVTSPPAVQVTTVTSGVDPDADGYYARVNDPRGGDITVAIGANDVRIISPLAVGSNTIDLLGVAPNCTVAGAPAVVTVAKGDTAHVAFTITCAPLVVSVTVTPASQTLAEGDTIRLTATPLDSAGNPLVGRQVAWTSGDPTVAFVGTSGLVTALRQGTTAIYATVEGQNGTATIDVSPGPSIDLGGEWVFTESLTYLCDDSGSFVLSSPTPATVAGTVSHVGRCPFWDTAVVNGQVSGRNLSFSVSPCLYAASVLGSPPARLVGTLSCYNGYGNYSGVWQATLAGPPVAVEVTPGSPHLLLRASQRLTAVVRDAAGHQLFGPAVTWSTDNAGVASVSPAGLVTGTGPGTATVTATAGGVSTTAMITVETIQFGTVAPGGGHTCGLTPIGAAYCWGFNTHGQLGNGSMSYSDPTPVPVPVSGGFVFDSVSAGWNHSCALTAGGTAYCWGMGSYGNLGDGSLTDSPTPVQVTGGLVISSISVGALGTCALTSGGVAYCWGDYVSSTPVAVPGGLTFTTLTKGWDHACGLTSGGVAYCWGENGYGQLGDGSTTASATPVLVFGGRKFSSLSAGDYATCGVTTGGAAYCWGLNDLGGLGNGTTTRSNVPVAVSGSFLFRSVSAGSQYTCGLTTTGAALCWGDSALTPGFVSGGLSFEALKAGGRTACAVTPGGVAYCWGENGGGQLGDGTTNSTGNNPVKIAGQP